jgi:uncharacterized protein (UPF0261 family)
MPDVIVVATLDTKSREADFVARELAAAGASCRIVDIGVFTDPDTATRAAVSADEVTRRAGVDIETLRTGGEQDGARGRALETMARGLTEVLAEEHRSGRLGCVLGIGGSSGSSVVGTALQALPVGVPKLLVSTMASGDVSPYVGTRDVTLMYSVTDIAGLNRITRAVLRNAAWAAAGMASGSVRPDDAAADRSLVAISMFGVTTPAVMAVQEGIEALGFETNVFHATGAGGRAMEDLVSDGLIDAVIDLTTSELTDELVGGVLSAGPDRMEAAGRAGIPQILIPGALEIVNFGAEPTVPAQFRVPERRLHVHNSAVTIVRTNVEESCELGRIFARKANLATGPTVVMLPLRGLSALDAPGQPYEDVTADAALFAEIRDGLRTDIPLVEVDAAINDPEFARAVMEEFAKVAAR